jgi:hypothetical protein
LPRAVPCSNLWGYCNETHKFHQSKVSFAVLVLKKIAYHSVELVSVEDVVLDSPVFDASDEMSELDVLDVSSMR